MQSNEYLLSRSTHIVLLARPMLAFLFRGLTSPGKREERERFPGDVSPRKRKANMGLASETIEYSQTEVLTNRA